MNEKQQAQLDALDDQDRHMLARAARVVAADQGIPPQKALVHLLDNPGELNGLAAECVRLANSLTAPPKKPKSEEPKV